MPSTENLSTRPRPHRTLWSREDLWDHRRITTRLLSDAGSAGQFMIETFSKDRIVFPDLLVYWTPEGTNPQDSLPHAVFLLGRFDPSGLTPLSLPSEALTQPGSLILYSLANHELVGRSKPFSAR